MSIRLRRYNFKCVKSFFFDGSHVRQLNRGDICLKFDLEKTPGKRFLIVFTEGKIQTYFQLTKEE